MTTNPVLEHINRFFAGMFRDASPTNVPPNTYYSAVNCTLISANGTNYVIKDCLGNVKTFIIPKTYNSVTSSFLNPPIPMCFVSFPSELYVLFTTDADYGAIGRIKYLPYGEGVQPDTETGQAEDGFVTLYHSPDLNFSKEKRIEAFAFQETELRKNIYFTDNNNEPRVINVADPRYTTLIQSGRLSSTAGVRYMVVEGALAYPSGSLTDQYGPGMSDGNIVTSNGINTTYSDLTGPSTTAKLIEYVPYELLAWTPDRELGNIQFKAYGTGSLYCGNKIYFTRLGLASGYKTTWSYPSSPVHITHPQDDTVGNAYHDTVGAGTSTTLQLSTKSVILTIQDVNTNYDTIELACLEYDQDWTVPRSLNVVASAPITGETMDIEHTGSNNSGVVTISELTLFPIFLKTVKTIATNKNYILAGNVTERPELDLPATMPGITLTAFNYPMPVLGDPQSCSNLMKYDAPMPVAGANPAATTIIPDARYLVTDDTGGPVQYPGGTFYAQGEVFVGISGTTSATIPVGTQVRPCVTKNRYNVFTTGDRVENAVEFSTDDTFYDYKSALVAQHCLGNWSGEKYRYAMVAFDLKGNPFYARFLGDITMPTITAKGGLMIARTYSGQPCYSLNPSGVRVSGLQIPASMIDQISGFSIVRAERDPRIVTQGLVSQVVVTGNTLRPVAWATPIGDDDTMAGTYFTFISPDHLVNHEFTHQLGQAGDTVEMAGWLNAIDYGGLFTRSVSGSERSMQSTFITPLTADTSLRSNEITLWRDYDEGGQEANFDGAGNDFQNTLYTSTGAGDAVTDGGCSTGSPDILSSGATGGRKCIFKIDAPAFLHYGPSANTYSDNLENGNPRKILMNYCRTNTNQYGGTGDAALANTLYMSTGHYQPINATVKTDTYNVGDDVYEFNDIEVFGGDCFVQMVDHGYGLWDDTLGVGSFFSSAWVFPCESNVNYGLRRGLKTSGIEMYYPGASAELMAYSVSGTSNLEGYSYNPGYSGLGQAVKYPALPVDFENTSAYENRIRYAGPKTPGETNDSFRTFLTLDKSDMDGQFGAINKIAVKDGRVLVWQDKATITVPILERQLLTGLQGDVTNIGTGGVVDRQDPITTSFGTQHQWSVIETEYGFAWFDMSKKAFMVFDHGVGEMSAVLGMKSFFDEVFVEALGADVNYAKLLNSPTLEPTSDQPLVGVGITGVYDPKLKITYMTFKFKQHTKVGGVFNYIDKDFTISYYHPKKMFLNTLTDWCPAIAHNHNGFVLAANNGKNRTKYFGTGMAATNFVVNETIEYGNIEYICIQDKTIPSYPTVFDAWSPTTDTAHWLPLNAANELWVNNQPSSLGQSTAPDYQYNKHFGKVIDQEFEFYINPGVNETIMVQAIEQHTPTNVNYTGVEVSFESESAADVSIRPTDRNYQFIFDKIQSSLPLRSRGKGPVVGRWLKVKFTKKNWAGFQTTLTGSVKILEAVRSFFTILK